MAYKAIKPVRFDRRYSIGETIPDAVVDPARAPNLQAMGMIMPMPKEELPKADQRPQKIASDDGGDTPADAENAADEAATVPAEAKKAKAKT